MEGVTLQDLLLPMERNRLQYPKEIFFINRPSWILISAPQRCIPPALDGFPTLIDMLRNSFHEIHQFFTMPYLQETTENPCDSSSPVVKSGTAFARIIE